MAESFKYGNGVWATKTGSSLAYNDENDNYKPLPFSVTRDSIATRVNKQGLIEVVGNDKLRIDYTDSSNGVALLEPARTNLVSESENFDNYWSKIGSSSIVSDDIIAPDGSNNGDKLIKGSAFLCLRKNSQVSIGTQYAFSIYAKKGSVDRISLDIGDEGVQEFILTDEWQRFSTTANPATYTHVDIEMPTGSSGDYIYLFGAQIEAGSYATSYIPTSGSTTQRQSDVANGAGNSEVFNDSEGVLFADIAALANDGVEKRLALQDNGTYDAVRITYTPTANSITAVVYNNTANQFNKTYIVNDATNFNKIALKYKVDDFALWINGFEVATDTSGSVFNAGSLDKLSYELNGVAKVYAKTKRLGYFDTALTDAELEALTSYTSFINMANELNLTIK